MDSNVVEETWMSNRENIVPLKGGRSMKLLTSSLEKSVTIEEAEKKFEDVFEESKNSKDPLSVIWKYVRWFENIFPSGKQKTLYPLLWRSVNYYSNFENLENDDRLIKLWLKLCDNYPTRSLAILECAFTKGVGRLSSFFYISWAEIYEAWGSESKARETLRMAKKYGATPISDINKAMDNLEMRCIKRSLDVDDASDMDTDEDEEIFETQPFRRNILGSMEGRVTKCNNKTKKVEKISIKKNQTSNETFKVYEDPITNYPDVGKINQPTSLEDDIEYQELFGFFDKAKNMKTISLKENENRGDRNLGIPGMSDVSKSIKEFEVFCDENEDVVCNSVKTRKGLTESKPSKSISKRMCKRAFLKGEISIVEQFLSVYDL
uniref:BUB1 N-terminal domain-containing protein n=1 Tax=Parastrongyloides trichosuri TaxID=131310 RepID=A0A0N4ZP93_PARTI